MLNKRFLTLIFVFGSIVLSAVGSFAQKRQVIVDKVVAIVGGSSVLYSDVEMYASELVRQRREEGYTSDRDPMNESLEALMKQKLLYNQSLIDSIAPNNDINSYVEERIQDMIRELGGSVSELERIQHMPLYNFREIMRQRVTEQQHAMAMQGSVTSDVVVTPGEVEIYFKSLKEEDIPIIPEQYVYAHIVRYPSSQALAKQRTKERLLEMRERIISGSTNMGVLARTYSVDPGSALAGGEYPPTSLDQLTPPFADALSKLKPGQVSEVVETEYGFHIIELMEAPKNGLYRYRHILLKPQYTIEELMEPSKMLDSLARVIRADSISFEDAAFEHSQDDLSKMNGGLVSNHDRMTNIPALSNVKYSATKFKRDDFGKQTGRDLNDFVAISKLKEGEVSDSFMASDVQGNELSKIVKLLDIIPTHAATMSEDYLAIEAKALEAKQKEVFDAWLKEKIDALYVYIDPEFRDGDFEFPNWVK